MNPRMNSNFWLTKVLPVSIAVILLLGAGWFWMSNNRIDTTDGELSDSETKAAIQMVSKLIKVPNEEPVVAVITDISSLLKEQVFYQGASNGDILFIYPKASKAIIYSADSNKLINVGPVLIGNQGAAAAVPAGASVQSGQ